MELAEKISKALDLTFMDQKEPEGNVCFANSDELRPEFKDIFTAVDLLNYEYAVLQLEEYKELTSSDLVPTDRKTFWKLVDDGRKAYEFNNK
ncbi:hypothetical protein ACFSX9_11115 [Flavobacterium ardleyense]|uniref:Uncharacterized protein n=1 Tax=Flavobacterium ardleyense TaxID=2038737 RepID=A0ABW5ZB08_9FLAO